jgi:teichuronic acid biosynthesis glycosyltransferase TuaH
VTVAIVAGATWSVPGFRGSERHLAEALADREPVLYADPPRSPAGAARAGLPTRPGTYLTHPRPGVTRVSVVLPGPERPGLRDLADTLVRRALRRAAAPVGPLDGVVVAVAHRDLLDPVPGTPRLFWATDDFGAGAALMGLPPARLLAGEGRVAAAGLTVLAASPELARRWEERGCHSVLFPNGVDLDRFARVRPPAREGEPPTAVFVGQLGPRVDPLLLRAVADRMRLRLVGPRLPAAAGADWDAVFAHPGVEWPGAVEFDAVPAELVRADVGLVPYRLDSFNVASFPLKALEYLAAGLPVAGSGLPALEWLGDSRSVATAADAGAFADAAVRLAKERRADPGSAERHRALAGTHDWRHRADLVRELLAPAAVAR